MVSFPQVPHQNPVYASPRPHTRYMSRPPHSSRFDHLNSSGWGVQIIQLLMQLPSLRRFLVPSRSKYNPQHPVLKHPHPAFFCQWIRLISSKSIYSNWVKFGPNWRPTMTQAVIRRPTTTKAWVWSRANPCRIFGGQSVTVRGLYPTNLVCPVSITLPVLHTHFFIQHQRNIITATKGLK